MNIFLTIVLIASVIFYTEAGECQVHNKPDYLSIVSNNNEQNSGKITVSNFVNNFLTVLGLSTDQNDKKEKEFFYSSRPLEIPATTWLFHVEGVDRLSNNGISLEDDAEFDINLINTKLRQTGDSNALNTVSILITSQSEIDNLKQTLENQISQMDKQASIKYFVIVCDECNNDKSIEVLAKQLKAVIDQIIANDAQTLAITLVTKESARVRRARQIDDFSNNGSNITIATMYSDNYPVMFNLFFWTSLALGLILISIVYVFLTLDPGQDTIIYRLTTPRLKAD